MTGKLTIRVATEEDAQAIAQLIQTVAHYFLASPDGQGAEAFLASISSNAILSYITNPAFVYIMAFVGNKLVGVAALKEQKHVYHLFVSPAFHQQGIAKHLWLHLKDQAIASRDNDVFTVNSSLYAVPVYSRFGFIATSEPQEKNGIQFQPMQLITQG